MSGPISLYLNGVERVDDHGMEWDWSTSETLGSTGSATITVQDRDNTLEPVAHWDVKLVIKSSGHVLWRGEVTSFSLELPDKFPWRRWKLQCSDYNGELPLRLMGAYDGKTWMDTSGLGIYVNIDPFASALRTDLLTVQAWFDHYFRVAGEAADTTEFVVQYLDQLDKLFMQDPNYGNLQSSLEDLAAMIIHNLQFWIDPDLKFHWVAIPAWQDLLVDAIANEVDDSLSLSAMLFPEGTIGGLEFAPYTVSDVGDLGSDIGFSNLKFDLDGGEMPEQVYVKGATGYVYNAEPIPSTDETKTVVTRPTSGVADRYELTLIADDNKIWHTDETGYISIYYDLVGSGGPYPVSWVRVPWNETRHKGGAFWKFLDGPHKGKMADDNTNVLSNYGEIVVYKITSSGVVDPTVGIGGSGWTNEVDQDSSKRQVYLEAISTTQSERDSVGGQALYRGQFETLRGSVLVRGYDGWRVGQLLRIQDTRLPSKYDNRYYIIQQVTAKPIEGQDYREYTLNFGDGPESRYTAERRGPVEWPSPVTQILVSAFDLTPGPNSSQRITGQLVNSSGAPWAVEGKTVNWSFECYNNLGQLQGDQGSVKPAVSSTDKHGRAHTTLKTGPGTNLVYYVFADVKAT